VLAHEALHRAHITFSSREIHSETRRRSAINCRTDSGNDAESDLRRKWGSNMINKLLGAAAMAAIMYSTVPASAASLGGCSGDNLTKTESLIEGMADGEGKAAAQKEVAIAQAALLDGKLGACAAHLSKAMHVVK
jgi:hypothetical protein